MRPFLNSLSLILAGCLTLPVAASAASDGVSPSAYTILEVGGLPITNSMLTTWAIGLFIIVVVRLLVGRARLVPTAGQTVIESAVLWVRDIVEPIVGPKMIGKVFPLLITLFLFILINNWSGLFPGVGSFGLEKEGTVATAAQAQTLEAKGYTVEETGTGAYEAEKFLYFFRPANSDLNTTLAMAILSQVAWLYFVLRYAGLGTLLWDLFGNKADPREVPKAIFLFLFAIFGAVGLIEVISILFRTISLPFRLYGNVYGGESLLTAMTGIFPYLLPVPFYFLELLIGFVQALVWTLLVAVYIGLICNHEGGEEGHAH
jgi:F-type H+-transporting ATPase subunit a